MTPPFVQYEDPAVAEARMHGDEPPERVVAGDPSWPNRVCIRTVFGPRVFVHYFEQASEAQALFDQVRLTGYVLPNGFHVLPRGLDGVTREGAHGIELKPGAAVAFPRGKA